jgi:hypothetical protein
MKTFPTVEEYIEVIAGYRDIVTGKPSTNWFFAFEPIISLARYDVDVLTSMCESSVAGKALTEKQGELACKIILKYQRQLANKSVDVSPVEKPVWRHTLRKMDYSRKLSIANDKLILRFPYTTKLIEELRAFRKDSQGNCVFDKDNRCWIIGLTEYNLNWVHTWASVNQFEIEPDVNYLVAKIAELEATPYAIELQCNGEQLEIANAPDSLVAYVNEHLGGFGFDNLQRLVDASSDLGYTINEDLEQAVMQQWGARFLSLAKHKELRIDSNAGVTDDDFASVLEYALEVGRTPVVIYEPDLSLNLFNRLKELYPDQTLDVGNGRNVLDRLTPEIKFIYTIKPIRVLESIPMLVSSAGMIFGGDKQIMMQRANKVVYTSADVYNKNNTGRKVVKLK